MATLSQFEEIESWQLARLLTRRVYECTALASFAKDWALQNQIRRAAVSVMSNVAEGFERESRAEFRHFLAIAKGSAAEVQSQLYVALDAGYISRAQFAELHNLATSVKRLLAGFRKYLSAARPRQPINRRRTTSNHQPGTSNQ